MVHTLSKTTGIDESIITRQFRSVFAAAGTLDFRNLIRNLEFMASKSPAERDKLVVLGRQAYDRSKRKALTTYPQLNETLEAIARAGVAIVGFSNAPFHHVYPRLQSVGALRFFSGLIAWEGAVLSESDPFFDSDIIRRERKVVAQAKRAIPFVRLLAKDHCKPSPYGYQLVREHFGTAAAYFVLGDSLMTDLRPAASLGMQTMWAQYGTAIDSKNLETILAITPWNEAQIKRQTDTCFKPDVVIRDPLELLQVLPNHWQPDLPLSYA